MIKATDIKSTGKRGGTWFVTAKIELLEYQKRFHSEPTTEQVNESVESFEENYAGLNDSTNKPLNANKYDKVS